MTVVVSDCCRLNAPLESTRQQQQVESPATLTASTNAESGPAMLVMAFTVLEWPVPGSIIWSSFPDPLVSTDHSAMLPSAAPEISILPWCCASTGSQWIYVTRSLCARRTPRFLSPCSQSMCMHLNRRTSATWPILFSFAHASHITAYLGLHNQD